MSPARRPDVNGALLCIFLLSGLCSCLRQYQLVDEPKTWGEAQQYCRERFIDLATVDNMEDVAQLIAAAGSGFSGKVWIGLYDNSSSWAWAMEDDGYYGKNNELFLRWFPGEPNDARNMEHLCTSVKNGFLRDEPCSKMNQLVCYDNSNASSPKHYFITRTLSWLKAQSYCRSFHTDLVSIRNEKEMAVIQKAVPKHMSASVGLSRKTWYSWSAGTQHEFKNWLTGHPLGGTGDCATSLISGINAGKWVEQPCDQKLPFMCLYNKKQRFQIKLTALKSTVDLNDPAVMEAILKLMEKKMKEKGITAGLKIAWVKKDNNAIFQEEEKNAD